MKNKIYGLFRFVFWIIFISTLIPIIAWVTFKIIFTDKIYSVEDSPNGKIAIVFGAGLQRDGTPSPVLKDRVTTAVNLLNQNKVEKLLFSGDNRFVDYDEPSSMKVFALQLGADPDAIVLDFAGRRTYDTCYRAKSIFGINQAILVTQNFHLPRALFLCNQFGINATGVSADIRNYSSRSLRYWSLREIFATTAAIWDAWFQKPLPVLGEEQPIFK